MFRRAALWLCSVTLANGTVLKGELNPDNANYLLKGVAVLPDGRVYSGQFDKLHGFPLAGSQLEEDGDLYRGGFNAEWQRDGQGESWLSDGTYYKGNFVKDELTLGIVRIPNGTSEITFEGTLKDELFVSGKLTEHDFTYVGEFNDNQPHGKGKLVFATGAEQEGTFFAGKLHGSDCKMKLDGGFVYVGEFMDGKIRSGTLYTPTYRYEGDFNEHGRAHGEGSQTYLINEPRLTFTGIWSNGAMIRGTCVDEYGAAVDWQDNHALQSSILGDSQGGEGSVAVNSYSSAKLKEADRLFREMNKSYAEDADSVARQTGTFPSKLDLGYEGGLQQESDALESSARKQLSDLDRSRESLTDRAKGFESVMAKVSGSVMGDMNENMAKIQFSRQVGAQELSSQRMDEQFERFMKTFDRPSSAPQETSEAIDEAVSSESSSSSSQTEGQRLNIQGNAPWKSFTPQ